MKSPLTFQNIDVSDVLKFSLSLLNRVIFKYVQQKEELSVSQALISNLFELADNHHQLLGSLLFGTLSEFTKPGLRYSAASVALLSGHLVKFLPKYTKSPLQTVFATKLLFALSNKSLPHRDADLAFRLAEANLNEPWLSKKGEPVSTNAEMHENLTRELMMIACLLTIEANDKEQGKAKR
jgi:hypothetical protein